MTVDGVVGVELERGDPADRGDVLVLLADRLAEPVDLDVAGVGGESSFGTNSVLVGVEAPSAGRR